MEALEMNSVNSVESIPEQEEQQTFYVRRCSHKNRFDRYELLSIGELPEEENYDEDE